MSRRQLTTNFYADELWCRCCRGLALHPGFVEALQALRDEFGFPMHITSGARCTEHNVRVGGHPRSLHVFDVPQHPGQKGTLAVDVATPAGAYRGRLFACAFKQGWSIGWGGKRGFLHLDRRDWIGKPQDTFDY